MHLNYIAAACCLVEPVDVLSHDLKVNPLLKGLLLGCSEGIVGGIWPATRHHLTPPAPYHTQHSTAVGAGTAAKPFIDKLPQCRSTRRQLADSKAAFEASDWVQGVCLWRTHQW